MECLECKHGYMINTTLKGKQVPFHGNSYFILVTAQADAEPPSHCQEHFQTNPYGATIALKCA